MLGQDVVASLYFLAFFAKYPFASTSAFRKCLFPGHFFGPVIFSDQDKLTIMHPTLKCLFIFVCLDWLVQAKGHNFYINCLDANVLFRIYWYISWHLLAWLVILRSTAWQIVATWSTCYGKWAWEMSIGTGSCLCSLDTFHGFLSITMGLRPPANHPLNGDHTFANFWKTSIRPYALVKVFLIGKLWYREGFIRLKDHQERRRRRYFKTRKWSIFYHLDDNWSATVSSHKDHRGTCQPD